MGFCGSRDSRAAAGEAGAAYEYAREQSTSRMRCRLPARPLKLVTGRSLVHASLVCRAGFAGRGMLIARATESSILASGPRPEM